MALRQQQEYLVRNRTFPFLPCYCVHSPIAANRITKPFMTLRQQQEYLVFNRRFPFLPCYCLYSPIATNRTTKPFMTLRQQQEYLVCNRRFPFLPYYCLHFPIATNRIAMRFVVRSARRFAIARNAPTIPKAELEAAHSRKNGRHILSVPAVYRINCISYQTAL